MTTASPPHSIPRQVGRYRWKICALLFFATTVNYVDRQAVALLKPVLQDPVSGIGLTEVNYGYIVIAFSLAYALGLLVVGGFIDRVGTKLATRLQSQFGPWPPPAIRWLAFRAL